MARARRPTSGVVAAPFAALVAALLVALVATVALAATGAAPATLGGPTPVDGCATITDPGAYALTSDVESADPGPCVEIRASDVTLDGRGHVVAGPGATTGGTPAATDRAGVVATGRNVTVRNLTASGWRVGVALDDVTGGAVRGVTADANGEGVVVAASSRVTVADSLARDAAAFSGVAVVDSRRVVVRNVTAVRSRFDGVRVAGSRNVSVAAVVARNNTRAGVAVARTTGSRVVATRAVRNGHVGVGLFGADGNALVGNVVADTRAATGAFALPPGGLVLVNASRNRVVRTAAGGNAVWTYRSQDGSAGNVVRGLAIGPAEVSFTGTDVALRPPSVVPEDPYDHVTLGRYVEVLPTSPNGTADLAVRYPETVARNESVDESTVALWRWAGGSWSPVDGSDGDPAADVAAGTVSSPGVVAPAGQRRSFAVADLDAPDAAGAGDRVRVVATVRNPNAVADEQPVELRVDGRRLDARRVRLPANATATVSFALDADALAPGDRVLAVQTRDDGAVASLVVRADGNRTAGDS